MKIDGRAWLLLAASVSFLVAVLHVIIVFIGPAAYSFFGGERLARLAAGGFAAPAVMTLLLATVLALFGIYALSGAGVIRRLPLLIAALLAIGGMYAFRGLSAIEQAIQILQDPPRFRFASSSTPSFLWSPVARISWEQSSDFGQKGISKH